MVLMLNEIHSSHWAKRPRPAILGLADNYKVAPRGAGRAPECVTRASARPVLPKWYDYERDLSRRLVNLAWSIMGSLCARVIVGSASRELCRRAG